MLSRHSCSCRAGLQQTHVEVRFENLSVETQVLVGSRNLPSVANSYRNIFEVLLSLLHCSMQIRNCILHASATAPGFKTRYCSFV